MLDVPQAEFAGALIMSRAVASISKLMFCLAAVLVMASIAPAQEKMADLYSTVLIAADLQDAKRILTIADPNEDGFIDRQEQNRISWRTEIPQYDLNKDGKLTHLEVAIRQAKLRSDAGVTQFDRNNANKFMRRKDRNGNGQLDPDEIALGWPSNPEKFDTDRDGNISLTEMAVQFAFNRGYRREVGIQGVDQTEAIRLRNQFDQDKDGKLAPDEWPAASFPREPKAFDENGDGLLGLEEIATLLAKHRMDSGLSNADQLQARRLIRGADFDQDGKVSKEEREQASSFNPSAKDLVKYDGNKDGEVTLAEVENWLAGERKEKGFSDEDLTAARRLLIRHDANRSNFLEQDELAETPGPGQLAAKLMGKIDLNDDEKIGLEEIAERVFRVHIGTKRLGALHERSGTVLPISEEAE
jgi:Ca2+-binding EF-hand superfamily protein